MLFLKTECCAGSDRELVHFDFGSSVAYADKRILYLSACSRHAPWLMVYPPWRSSRYLRVRVGSGCDDAPRYSKLLVVVSILLARCPV